MAPLTPTQIQQAAKVLGDRMYVAQNRVADMSTDDLAAGIEAIDLIMNEIPPNLPNQAASIIVNINQAFPEPFKTTATLADKSEAITVWAAKVAGVV